MSAKTWEEPALASAEKVALLTYVLGYDDLLADASATLRVPEGDARITIGRGPQGGGFGFGAQGELGLPDNFASGQHAVLRRSGSAHTLEDQRSRNGTFVNGIRISEQRLFDGDLIELGHSLLCYRLVDAALARAVEDAGAPTFLGPTRTRAPEVAALVRDLQRVARSTESVLLLGETGCGKEIAANAIHELSGRAGALVAVDCGAVPESLFESTFFGHRRGAFTGAGEARVGEIAKADGGTLFLDEVGNMSVASQAKLLRVIEDGRVTPLGAPAAQQVSVRWVAATNSDPFARETSFRSDLLRRLAGYVGRIPPLRRRREDLGALTAHLLRDAAVARASITAPAGRRLFSDPFPGNIRQLRATLRSAAVLARGAPIDTAHLGDSPAEQPLSSADRKPASESTDSPAPAARAADASRPDAATIEAALARHDGNVVHAARELGAHPRQLYRYIERFGISLDKHRRQ